MVLDIQSTVSMVVNGIQKVVGLLDAYMESIV